MRSRRPKSLIIRVTGGYFSGQHWVFGEPAELIEIDCTVGLDDRDRFLDWAEEIRSREFQVRQFLDDGNWYRDTRWTFLQHLVFEQGEQHGLITWEAIEKALDRRDHE